MTDIKTKEERSRNMAAIKSKDTKPEVWFRKELHRRGYRYRKNVSTVPGHPDIWLSGYRTAVFIHGCFWHRHEGCRYAYMPKIRVEFWQNKFKKNVERDRIVRNELGDVGIKMLIVWECTVKKMMKSQDIRDDVIESCEQFFGDDQPFLEL